MGLDAGRILGAPQPPVGVVEVVGGAERLAVGARQNADEMPRGVVGQYRDEAIGQRDHRLPVGVVVLDDLAAAPQSIDREEQPTQAVVEVGGGEIVRVGGGGASCVYGLEQVSGLVVYILRHRLVDICDAAAGGIDGYEGGGARDLPAEVVGRIGAQALRLVCRADPTGELCLGERIPRIQARQRVEVAGILDRRNLLPKTVIAVFGHAAFRAHRKAQVVTRAVGIARSQRACRSTARHADGRLHAAVRNGTADCRRRAYPR